MQIGSLDDLAARADMPSRTTLQLIVLRHSAFPFIERGGPGRAHKIDLDAAARFVQSVRHLHRTERLQPVDPQKRREFIRLHGLQFVSEDEPADG